MISTWSKIKPLFILGLIASIGTITAINGNPEARSLSDPNDILASLQPIQSQLTIDGSWNMTFTGNDEWRMDLSLIEFNDIVFGSRYGTSDSKSYLFTAAGNSSEDNLILYLVNQSEMILLKTDAQFSDGYISGRFASYSEEGKQDEGTIEGDQYINPENYGKSPFGIKVSQGQHEEDSSKGNAS